MPNTKSDSTGTDTHTCAPSYDAAVSTITSARLGQGLEHKLLTKVTNAWRMYSSGKKNSSKDAAQQLDVALRLLDSPATKQIEPLLREKLRQVIQSFKNCVSGTPVQTATLTVRTFFPPPTAIAPGSPAGTGVIIMINGSEFGTTGSDGTVIVEAPAGAVLVAARSYPSSEGMVQLTLLPGERRQVDIVLQEGKEFAEPTELALDELQDGMLDSNFASFKLRFLDDTRTVALQSVSYLELLDPRGGPSRFLETMFALQPDSTIAATDIPALKKILVARTGAVELRVFAVGQNNRFHHRRVRFYLSKYRAVCKLQPPPSAPGLNIAGIYVTATILNTDLVFRAVSDATGAFEFPLLPAGSLSLNSETLQNQKHYYGEGVVPLRRNVSVGVNMLHTADLINHVPGLIVSALAAVSQSKSSAAEMEQVDASVAQARQELAASLATRGGSAPAASLQAATAEDTANVHVEAGRMDELVSATDSLTVPQGTNKVALKYTVQTDEYPAYVLAQSIFNDTWSLQARDSNSGQRLYAINRQINSQLDTPPVWQSDGTTGEQQEVLNVAELTTQADASLTLYANATNIGDGILPTRVTASLDTKVSVHIGDITADTVVPTTGDSRYFSIPRTGETNTFERFFEVKFTKPETATVKNLEVTLLGEDGPLMTILDEAPGENIEEEDEETLKVRVTMHDKPSEVNSVPPPTHAIRYRFMLTVEKDGEEASDEKESAEFYALWHMPDSLPRYSQQTPDKGGDYWCARGTYHWLEKHATLVKAINDISGEHARNIGHETHQYGTDIDMYHFYKFPDADPEFAITDYKQLQSKVQAWANGDAAAMSLVNTWVLETRKGIDALAALSTVNEIFYIRGAEVLSGSTQLLTPGWARELLKTGKTTVNGKVLDLKLPAWDNSKYKPRNDHDDHVHLVLNRNLLPFE